MDVIISLFREEFVLLMELKLIRDSAKRRGVEVKHVLVEFVLSMEQRWNDVVIMGVKINLKRVACVRSMRRMSSIICVQ